MSVIVAKRGETKLKVLSQAEELANYTINLVTNEKHFPKRYRWIFARKIGDSAINLNSLVNMANSTYPSDRIACQCRYELIIKALGEVNNLLALVSLCKQQEHITLKNLEHWLEMITFEKTLILKWKENCKSRLDKFPS